MFHIKICGITNVEDALTVAQAGADAVGLNFYPPSPRFISPEVAREIALALPKGVVRVGVFVNSRDCPNFRVNENGTVPFAASNPTPTDICRLFDETPLDMIQLHGDEPPEFILQMGNRPVMKVFHLKSGTVHPIVEYLDRCRELAALPRMVMIDSQAAGQYGGTGKTCDWNAARQYVIEIQLPPLVLAGGLTPENVAEAIRTVRPAAVDAASGVESSPGRKDPALVAAFIRAAGEAMSTFQ